MILFLTYHQVLRETEPEAEFYTIRSETLELHLQMLEDAGLRPMDVHKLTQEGNRPAVEERPEVKQPVPFLLSFDDGTRDHYEIVLPVLAKAKRTAIFFVPTSRLNRPGYLTSAMVREMSQAGHTIGLHGHEHRRLDTFGEEDIRVQMEISRGILGQLTGAPPILFAPPGGFMDRRVQRMALEAGVRAIRTMRWGYNRRVDLTALQCVPLNRNSGKREFQRVLEFRSQAAAYAMKQMARRLLPKPLYASFRQSMARVRAGKS